jgi:hypothetical protein
MKKFKEFLENYDVYLDMPKKLKKVKKPEIEDEVEITSNEDTAQEAIAGKVIPGKGV